MVWTDGLLRRFGILISMLFAGCSSSDSAIVKGIVLVDGFPAKNGTIAFVPADGSGEPTSIAIRDGHYEMVTSPGAKLIQISVPVVIGQRRAYEGPGAPMIEISEESVPPRFNSQTELKMTVRPGNNTKDWSITNKSSKNQ